MQSPVDLAVGIQDGPAERIQVSGAQGGPGIGLYGSFYYRLSDIILEGQLRSGGFVAQQLEFVRNKKERFKYSLGPHATTYTEHPPVLMINGQQPYFVQEGDTLTLTMNASDPDGQVVMLSAAPNLGTARFDASNGVAASGTYTLDAIPPRRGHYSVAFEARDPTGLTDTETVMITVVPVNHPPTLSVPATVRVEEGQILTIPISGSDPDGDTVRLTAMPLPDHAVFIQSINSITFAPDYTQAGLYSIICQAHDGITSSLPAVVQVTVDDVTGGSQSNRLTLTVNPAESPTLVAGTRITGTVNSPSNPPPPQIISTALIVGVAPANARQGTVLDVSLTGKSTGKYVTHFIQDLSHADFGSGITVDSLIVTNSTQAIARISIDSAAVVGIRGIRVVSGDETSVAVPAFSIETGRTRVDGILRDPDTGLPLAGADIRIEGTLLSITTAPDGSFSFSDVPPGHHVLIVNANNHKLLRLEFDAEFGIVTDLGVLTSPTTVFDPTVSASVSLFSVLGRGIGELRPGKLTMEEARAVVRDTLLLLGGNEIGVYDAHGVQLNPEVDGDGLMSMKDKGVDNYAGQLVRGESVTLLEVLYDVSFAFAGYTNGTPPAFEEWLGILQQMVNKAWADPSDPFSAVAIVVF
ncbi:MAG: carboxypeptidase regulatory-like domain-containing protein, partial [Anaerolineales bacterium]|nr:carboxypeptidase regulatory-like domain-containing protein [Anaerolineales bacterium]